MKVEDWPIDKPKPYPNNPRKNDEAAKTLAKDFAEFGWQGNPVIVDADGVVLAGHTRLKAAKLAGMQQVPVVVSNLTGEKAKAFRLADNKTGELADWDMSALDDELGGIEDIDMSQFGFDTADLLPKNGGVDGPETIQDKIDEHPTTNGLNATFLVPPFSILRTMSSQWQQRKKWWLDQGIKSELGRDDKLVFDTKQLGMNGSGTSIFDPVLTELIYRWFMPDEGKSVFDPFAGGSVRGIVASMLGLNYTGIDLRQAQIEANKQNAKDIGLSLVPNWITGDSAKMDDWVADESSDLIIACPPYYDLEKYSDDPNDISNMETDEFDATYEKIMANAVTKLKPNRFACVILSDVRYKSGFYRDLSGLTKRAMAKGGANLYNEMILANSIGSAAMRARRAMKFRKVTRVHQEVLVFFKGDYKLIPNEFSIMEDIDESLKDISGDEG